MELSLPLKIALLSLGLFAAGLVFLAIMVLVLPVDYFARSRPQPIIPGRYPALRIAGRIAKNLAGILLGIVGIVLAVPGIPGPGVVILLIGLALVDFPGKYRLQKSLIRKPGIGGPLNWLRAKFGRPKFLGVR